MATVEKTRTEVRAEARKAIRDATETSCGALLGEIAALLRRFVVMSDAQALVVALVAVSAVAHGLNMLNYPVHSRFGDEGIYLMQAWSVLRHGELAPYTYWYDHAPASWLLIAGWLALTGGPHAFFLEKVVR